MTIDVRVDEAVLPIGRSDLGRHLGARHGRAFDVSRLRPRKTNLIGEMPHFSPGSSPGFRRWNLPRLVVTQLLGDDGNKKGSQVAPLCIILQLPGLRLRTVRGCPGPASGPARLGHVTPSSHLDRRARHRAECAEDAAIAIRWPQHLAARRSGVGQQAGERRHRLQARAPAHRTGDE